MNKIYKKALVIAVCLSSVGFTLNSCKDAIDIEQPGLLDDATLFTSVSNLNDYLVGSVYANMDTNNDIYFSAVFTDEVKPGAGSGGQEYEIHRYFIDPTTGLTTGIWAQHYLVINRVNRLLAGAANIKPANAEETKQYNYVVAQARAIRAFCYLQLETFFAPDMKDPNGLGVLLLKDVPAVDIKLPRSKNQDVYDFIEADLDYARSILTSYATLPYPTTPATPLNRYYVNKRFVNAVAARFNLYRGNYVLAKQYAQDVISNSGLSLTAASAYPNMWNDTSEGEIIFALNRLATGNGSSIGTRWNTNSSSITGNPMWALGRNLFNIINTTPGDIRRTVYIDPSSIIDPNYLTSTSPRDTDQLVIDKYPGKTSAATRNDLKVFRLSEMYFILAECETAANNFAGAAALIQQVRAKRNTTGTAPLPVYASSTAAYADILKERRVDLALEGHRYIDLKRLANAAGVTMDRNQTDDVVTVTNLPNNSYKYTLPIPVQEINLNPQIQQNPGY
ncbi:SusD family [Chryseobacterium gleum]|uniref:SusD family n=2 Tax=Chryseobacterium gleum TaxID=250 RepID=A0A3S4NWL0_CHRGE|nr:RagB/SusD family nutrient uptake outer membrane protein [Chryseobacterium gleum]EFK37879.1 SusD family protein [Chryseobacterium gleum ATCC 35910]QQY32659.1 RagB/SusD family nutrient uptake outer membrane protein [Chryseobacterium gleum]VEE10114.1 SusD family [Chryseobacterium gleum]